MNILSVTQHQTIHTLSARGWSARRIAREIGIHRTTVSRYLRNGGPKPTNTPHGSRAAKTSSCEAHRPQIEASLAAGLSGRRIYQDLKSEAGFRGSYDSVKRFIRLRCQANELPFRRMECAAGEEIQVDFGQGAWVIEPDGRKRRPHLFRAVLSHSRKGYAEVVWDQCTETFLRCLENAYRALGGVPAVTVTDNLKASVLHADWFDPELNPKAMSFAEHYHTALLPTKPATPRHKGKVEAGVDYVQENALRGRKFRSLADQTRGSSSGRRRSLTPASTERFASR